MPSDQQSRPLLSWLVPHRDRARSEFLSAHQLQVDKLRQSVEQLRASADYPRVHDEFVLIDQPQLRQCQRQRQSSREQSLTRLRLELLNGLLEISPKELRIPVYFLESTRHDVFLFRVDRAGEGSPPVGRSRRRPLTPTRFHHLVG